jgi:rod shape-determining protein MreC
MAGLTLILFTLGQVRLLDPVQGLFLTAGQPIEQGLRSIFRPVSSTLGNLTRAGDLEAKNRELRLEIERLQVRVQELEREAELVKELEQALETIRGGDAETRLLATVVHRDASAYSDVISINRGSDDGLREGMVVLSPQGSVLGSVTRTFASQAFVRLITDSRSRVAAIVPETQAEGVVKGGFSGDLTLDLARAEVRKDDVVVTSGLGGNFPAGLPVARVVEVAGTPQDLFRSVTLEPLVRLSTVETVVVLMGFLPQSVELGRQ